MTLDLTPLNKAIEQLEVALVYCNGEAGKSDPKLGRMLQMAAIQAFEFTYELSWKMLKRYLEASSGSPQTIEQMAFPDLIRTGNEQALLLSDWPGWRNFREARSITSHVYDEEKAKQVFAIIPQFKDEARFLLAQLEERLSTS